MSWDSYLDFLDTSTLKKMKVGAICGKDGSVWACRGAQKGLDQKEVCSLIKICENSEKDTKEAQTQGVYIDGTRYRYLRNDTDEKSVDFTTSVDGKLRTGVCTLTGRAAVVCVTEEASSNANCHSGTCKVADYLKNQGY